MLSPPSSNTHLITLLPRSSPPPFPIAPSIRPSTQPSSGFSPTAILCIVAAIVVILLCVPLIALTLRRYERKRLIETMPKEIHSISDSVREEQSLKSILVTRELQRESVRVSVDADGGVEKPGRVYSGGWKGAELRGGGFRWV
ncbi:hypothetical protein NX059_010755 [Plenodomus lindquistii]|nr:hypothetical protein NX059_010755 [Plenodomus lindquistii]